MSANRAETGPMRFGKDWTGVFIRGDDAQRYAVAILTLLAPTTDPRLRETETSIMRSVVRGLANLLASCDERRSPAAQQIEPFNEVAALPAPEPGAEGAKP